MGSQAGGNEHILSIRWRQLPRWGGKTKTMPQSNSCRSHHKRRIIDSPKSQARSPSSTRPRKPAPIDPVAQSLEIFDAQNGEIGSWAQWLCARESRFAQVAMHSLPCGNAGGLECQWPRRCRPLAPDWFITLVANGRRNYNGNAVDHYKTCYKIRLDHNKFVRNSNTLWRTGRNPFARSRQNQARS
jgi:hypothetical protein